jgi:hypothetical protein
MFVCVGVCGGGGGFGGLNMTLCRDAEEVAGELGLTKKGKKRARDRAKRRYSTPDLD